MTRENAVSRRKALKVTGAAATTALVAGCGGGGNGNGNGGSEDGGNGDDSGNGGGSGGDSFEIESGTTIDLSAQTNEWLGLAPDSIADVSNPTLVLQEGETYEIGWSEGDGSQHNIELWNDSDEVVEDYETSLTNEESPDDQVIEFEATSEITQYVCRPHADTGMRGDIQVE